MNRWWLKDPRAVGAVVCLFVVAAAVPKVLAYPSVLLYQKDGAAADDIFGVSVAGAGDVNGDGRADVIIGAPLANPGGRVDAGSAYVYSGLNGTLLYQKDGGGDGDNFGYSVAGAGDVNNDGYADFIIGAYLANGFMASFLGKAYVYSGLNGGLLYQKNGEAAGDNFGWSVAGAGDVNGDGYADFIIGAPYAGATDAGSAYVYSGLGGGLLYQRNGQFAGDNFGYSVAGAGDVNGDGYADVIIGGPRFDPPGKLDAGRAYVYTGQTGTLWHVIDGAAGGDNFGYSVAGAGDVNGDGKDDFIIGAPYADAGGRYLAGSAYVYSGPNTGVLYQLYQKDGAAASDYLGTSVAGAGDVNGDGYADFIIGAPFANPGGPIAAGSAYVYSGLSGDQLCQKDGAAVEDYLGTSVAGAGDVNGDGIDEFIVGAPNANPGGRNDAGSAYVIAYGYFERVTRLADVPNDQGRQIRIGWSSRPGADNFVKQFAIYRRIDQLLASGKAYDPFDLKNAPPGAWEFIQSVPAAGDTVYGAIVPTLFDSTISGGMVRSVFFVRALSDNPIDHFDSPIDSGYSLDNLAPAPPPSLMAAYAGANVDLDWRSVGDADFDYFWVYRDTVASFALSALKRVGSTSDTTLLDTSVPSASAVYYKVTAVDFSGNEGSPSNETSVNSCHCSCHADPECNGIIVDVGDIVAAVDVIFRGGAEQPDPNPACPYSRADVNCDGFLDIGDIPLLVDVAFRGFTAGNRFCDPCP